MIDESDLLQVRARLAEYRLCLKALATNPSLNLEDRIYDVRDREGQGWDGPDVKQWGDAVTWANKLLKEDELL